MSIVSAGDTKFYALKDLSSSIYPRLIILKKETESRFSRKMYSMKDEMQYDEFRP